jgi:hypothetical protein
MESYKIEITPRIKDLVRSGVITIGVHITSDGTDVWVRTVQPHPRLDIKTYESMTLLEAETRLSKVSTHASSGLSLRPVKKTAPPPSGEEGEFNFLGFESVPDAVSFGKQVKEYRTDGGVRNKLPLDSLTPHDLGSPVKTLYARACSVADRLGTAKIVSRIATKPDSLGVQGCRNLAEWWSGSTATQRLVILSHAKVFQRQAGGIRIKNHWIDQLEQLPCPFRQAEAQVGQSEAGPSAETELSCENSSSEAESYTTEGVLLEW